MTNQENQLNQLIQRIMMIQQVENWSWFFCKVPQVYWVLFRYLPELTGPKLSCNRSRRHDEPAEPIESTHTLQIVLQNSAQSWEKSDILQLKKSTLINSHYMGPDDFWPSYRRSKSADGGKSESFTEIMRCSKKNHCHNLQNWACILNQRGTNPLGSTLIRYGASILQIVAVSFFFGLISTCLLYTSPSPRD